MNKDQLKEKILQGVKDGDIATLYTLENTAHELLDEEALHGYYANILDLALENLTNILEAHRKIDMQDVQDFATLRALYEYAIEHYSAGDYSSASALFEVLSGITDDEKFTFALKQHHKAAEQKISLDDFLENYADIAATQNSGSFYINHFKKTLKEQ